jgi:hypothetical protein
MMSIWMGESVNAELFQYIEAGRLDEINKFTSDQIRPFLPILARSSLIQQGDAFGRPLVFREPILVSLSEIEAVNNIVTLLSVEYQPLEVDIKKEIQMR